MMMRHTLAYLHRSSDLKSCAHFLISLFFIVETSRFFIFHRGYSQRWPPHAARENNTTLAPPAIDGTRGIALLLSLLRVLVDSNDVLATSTTSSTQLGVAPHSRSRILKALVEQ